MTTYLKTYVISVH